MAKYECTTTVRATPAVVWRQLGDVARWPDWQLGIVGAELVGPFGVGGRIRLRSAGDTEELLNLVEVDEPHRLAVTGQVGLALVHYEYRSEVTPAGLTSLVHRVEVDDAVTDQWLTNRLADDVRYGLLTLATLVDPTLRPE
jgi:hypothetical protein